MFCQANMKVTFIQLEMDLDFVIKILFFNNTGAC